MHEFGPIHLPAPIPHWTVSITRVEALQMLFVFLISTDGAWYPELVKDTREPGLCHGGFPYRSETYWPGDDFVQITTFSSLHFLFTMDVTGLLWGLTQV